ncbi:glycosyltransferase [Brevibacterium samyangense]
MSDTIDGDLDATHTASEQNEVFTEADAFDAFDGLNKAERKAAELIERSGFFAVDWYQLQRGQEFSTAHEAIADFVLDGAELGLAPHPLFVHSWITRDLAGRRRPLDVLVEYLENPDVARRTSTHPLFDASAFPGHVRNAANPLATFLATSTPDTPLPYDADRLGLPEGLTLRLVEEAATAALVEWTMREEHLPGLLPDPGVPLAVDSLPALTAEAKATFVVVLEESPNDFRQVYEHIAGPRAVQRFGAWEMLVLDPYRVEDAEAVVGHIASRDPRVRYLATNARTRSGAVSESVSEMTGTAVFFTRPGLVWEEAFTRSALAAIASGEPAIRSVDQDGVPLFSRLRDAILPGTVVSTEALRQATIDPELREAAGVDLVYRVMEGEELPSFLEGENIAVVEAGEFPVPALQSPLEHALVLDRWHAEESAPVEPGTAGLVVLGLTPRGFERVAVTAATFEPEQDELEVLVLAESTEWSDALLFSALTLAARNTTVVDGSTNRAVLLNCAIRSATASTLVITHPDYSLEDGEADWSNVIAEVETTGTVTHPLVLDDHESIVDAGSFYPGGAAEPAPLLAGRARHSVQIDVRTPVPTSGFPLVARTADIRRAGGFSPLLGDLWLAEDLIRRMPTGSVELRTDVVARTGGRPALPHVDRTRALAYFRERRGGARGTGAAEELFDAWDVTPLDTGTVAWADTSHSDAWGAQTWIDGRVQVSERGESRTWLILPRRTGTDVHGPAGALDFAESLAAALRAQGQKAVVQDPRSTGWTARADVVVDLDGTVGQPLPTGATTVLWATDNMDRVDIRRARGFDLAYAAAPLWAEKVSALESLDVKPLLLCTDPQVFPFDAGSPFSRTSRVVNVGERKPWRQVSVHGTLQNLAAARFLTVYGSGWTGHVPPQFIAPGPETAEDLLDIYRSAFYVTVDHRPELRDLGFVSSQVFDVLSAGGHLLMDDVHGIDELFGGQVARYRNRVELGWAYGLEWVCYYPTPEGQARLAAEIAERHSFAARAKTLVEDVRALPRL